MQNQPKAIYNAILGWDYKGFSSRFSLRYQELTLQSIDTQYGLEDSYYDNVLLFDISLKQQIIENLSVFANATNVNSHVDNYYYSHPAYLTVAAGKLADSRADIRIECTSLDSALVTNIHHIFRTVVFN